MHTSTVLVGTAATVLPWVGLVLALVGVGTALAGCAVLLGRMPSVPADPVPMGP